MSWFQKLLFQIFAHEGFVKACPVGWIPTTGPGFKNVYSKFSPTILYICIYAPSHFLPRLSITDWRCPNS